MQYVCHADIKSFIQEKFKNDYFFFFICIHCTSHWSIEHQSHLPTHLKSIHIYEYIVYRWACLTKLIIPRYIGNF